MKLSSAHKAQLSKVTRVALAGAMVVGSVSTSFASPVEAQLTSVSVALNDTRPSETATTYVVTFTPAASELTEIEQVDVKFCTQAGTWNDTCTAPTGMAFDTTGVTVSGFGNGSGGAQTVTGSNASNVITVDLTAAVGPETAVPHIMTFPNLTNSSQEQTHYARIRTFSDGGITPLDNGSGAFAILDQVVVSGTVLESMTFYVTNVAAATACSGGAGETSTDASTATTLPFGNFTSGTPQIACHRIATATNAANGYSTKVQNTSPGAHPIGTMCRQTASLCSNEGGQAGIAAGNYISNSTLTGTAEPWVDSTTFGVGVNANGGRATGFDSALNEYKTIIGASGVTLASHTSTDTQANSYTYVVYQADVPADQTAGVYQNQIEYITTPVF